MLILIALAQVLLNTVEGMFFPSNIKVCLKSVTAMFIGYIIAKTGHGIEFACLKLQL